MPRILTNTLVVLIVFTACISAWLGAWSLVPPEFGMPEYEEEIELAFLVGSVAYLVVPVFVSIRVCGFLRRRLAVEVV